MAFVKAEDLIFVVGDDQVVRREGDKGRGIAGTMEISDPGGGGGEGG